MDDVEEEEAATEEPEDAEGAEGVEAELEAADQEASEKEDNPPAEKEKETPEIPKIVQFKVSTDEGDFNIDLKKEIEKTNHNIYINDKKAVNVNAAMDLQILAAHGYINSDTDQETKSILQKILNRDNDFKGKNEAGIVATINDKMSSRLGVQGYSKNNLMTIIQKG